MTICRICYKNNMIIPIVDTAAPNISLNNTFSLKIIMEKGIIITGDMDVIEETIPVAVYCTANRENTTPMKGPNTAPTIILPNALLWLKAAPISAHCFFVVTITVRPIKAAINLI